MRRCAFFFAVCLLAACLLRTEAAPKTTVILPDAGTYAYWVQSQTGTVSVLPTTVSHRTDFTLPPVAAAGDTLFVLDAHNGGVAVRPLASPGNAVTLAVTDFKPLAAPPSVATVPKTPPVPSAPPSTGNGVEQFFRWLLGLCVVVVVVWFIIRLVQTRGEPLLALARRLGIDVPDPKPITADPGAALPVYEPPKPRLVEKIPDEAGAPPPVLRPRHAPSDRVPSGFPHLVGTQGLAAGSIFSLADGVMTVGRDGGNAIVLAENTVSRLHAKFIYDGGQIRVTDEGSANGVYVNGDRVQQATLVPGDELKIGDNYFRYEA